MRVDYAQRYVTWLLVSPLILVHCKEWAIYMQSRRHDRARPGRQEGSNTPSDSARDMAMKHTANLQVLRKK